MPTRDVWSPGSGRNLPDLLASALAILLLRGQGHEPAYFSSPWMSDFTLLPNSFREVAPLFPDGGEESGVRFTQYLARLADLRPVRIITVATAASRGLATNPDLRAARERGVVAVRFTVPEYHEKGILAPTFYLEGSMNITYHGVFVREEKVTYHAAGDAAGDEKIARAYLEYDRRWAGLGVDELV